MTFPRTVGLLLALLAVGRTADAQISVTNTNDNGPGSLRQALADAASGDVIDFVLNCPSCRIRLTSGELVIDKNLTINGFGADRLIVDGDFTTRVFRIAPGVVAEIQGLQVRNGHADYGAGILVDQATLTLEDAIVSGNEARIGAGIDSSGALTIVNVLFSSNHASMSGGAGIFARSGQLTIRDSGFRRNTTVGGGGAVRTSNTGVVARIIGSAFSDNSAVHGGALLTEDTTQAAIIGCTFTNNHATGLGGGIYVSGGTVEVVSTTLNGNSAAQGGGIASDDIGLASDHEGNVALVNSTITGSSSGGGVFINGSSGGLAITNSTIVLNQGSGLYGDNLGSGALANTIVAGNSDVDVNLLPSPTGGNNLIGGDVSAIVDTTLADNGGSTKTHALVAGSPAIDAGSNDWLPADALDLDGDGNTTEPIPFDQRGTGFPRLTRHAVDIGAIEAVCPPLVAGPTNFPNAAVGHAYSQSLTVNGGQAPYHFSAANLPAGLALSSDGTIGGIPISAGTFVFSVTVVEDGGCATTIEITLTVKAAPVAVNDTYTTSVNTPLTIAAPGVLANDSTGGGGPLTVALVSAPTHGTLTLSPDGGFTYTPANGFAGGDTFTYRATNGETTVTATSTINVRYRFTGFFAPVDNLPVVNRANGGQAIPLKFSLGGYQGLAIFAPGSPSSQQVSCGSGAQLDDIEPIDTPGASGLQYDAKSDTYIYVWKTEKSWKNSCRQLTVTLADGSTQVALFQFPK